MTEHPIIFSGPMVCALWDGRKTQDRRVLKPQPDTAKISPPFHPEPRGGRAWVFMARDDFPGYSYATADFRTQYAPGDRLWVREAWRTDEGFDDRPPRDLPNGEIIPRRYEADGARCYWRYEHVAVGRYRHARFMPRGLSRLTLTVTDVRVQRVQEISYLDTCAEGVDCETCAAMGQSACYRKGCGASRQAFRDLWDSLNAKRGHGWDVNPWVPAYTFTVERRNIDQ